MHNLWITIFLLVASPLLALEAQAAVYWTKLNENSQSKLSIDKQTITEKDQLKKAWLKIEYKTPQKNLQDPEKTFNLSKVLWYFDCPAQKSATSQVVQYLNGEMVFSAGIDAKKAEFIEPVPETDVDVAMRFVCAEKKPVAETTPKPAADGKAKPADPANTEKKDGEKTEANAQEKSDKSDKEDKSDKKEPAATDTTKADGKPADTKNAKKEADAKSKDAHKGGKPHWSYEGEGAPENWGKLNPENAMCDSGRNQSPINIDKTIHAALKNIRWIQKFPAKEIVNNGHTVQINFKEGNMLVLDDTPYQMKQVHFHAPSENLINNKSFPLEAHFVHADNKGNLTVIGVMFKEGEKNSALDKLWAQMPKEVNKPEALKARFVPSDMIPQSGKYYRFSGSLTTPPCSEGVRWIVMKTPISASKEQIKAFEELMKHHNNRPVQPLNGRPVLE